MLEPICVHGPISLASHCCSLVLFRRRDKCSVSLSSKCVLHTGWRPVRTVLFKTIKISVFFHFDFQELGPGNVQKEVSCSFDRVIKEVRDAFCPTVFP